jgi:hypothetical protein
VELDRLQIEDRKEERVDKKEEGELELEDRKEEKVDKKVEGEGDRK